MKCCFDRSGTHRHQNDELWFPSLVLHYSIKPAVYPLALKKLAAAVRLVRTNHEVWHVDPEKSLLPVFQLAVT